MTIQKTVGFNIFIDLAKQEELLKQLLPIFQKINWKTGGAYFNYHPDHCKIWVRAAENDTLKDIQQVLAQFHLTKKEAINSSYNDYYIFYSDENLDNFDDLDKDWLIKIKEEGTKYALHLKEELRISPETLTNEKMQQISVRLAREKPEIIQKLIEFHFILNPLVHFDGGKRTEEQIKMRCLGELLVV